MKKLHLLFLLLLTVPTAALILFSVYYDSPGKVPDVFLVSKVRLTMGSVSRDASLPLTLKDLPERTAVSVSFSLPEDAGPVMFFGSVYAPLTITINGEEVYEYGISGSYPSFMGDPPTQYDSISLPSGASSDIYMNYLSPAERTTLTIHAPVAGSGNSISHYLISRYGLAMIMAVIFLFLGSILIIIAPFFIQAESRSQAFIHLGLLCLFAGAWQFGENPVSVFLFRYPSLLYMLDFLGLFLLVIPMYRMGMQFLNLKSDRLLNIILNIMRGSVLICILLQLTGNISFHRSLFYFHILLPAAILVLTVRVLIEYLYRHNRTAGLFFIPFLILTVCAVLELINYRLHFLPLYSSAFQAGLFMFIIAMIIFSCMYVRNLYALSIRNMTLENEIRLQDQTITAAKKRNEMLLSHYEEIRRQRHDIRHHLRTLNDMIIREEYDQAAAYIGSVTALVPSYTPENYCENTIVNATFSCYAQEAARKGIRISIHAQVPGSNPNITDSNLCVIFGNLLENAVEACERLREGDPYILLNASIRGEVLFIMMENSFDGYLLKEGDLFSSRKRQGIGTGLSSIRSLAEAHKGAASFQADDRIFRSEIYLRL